MEAHRPPARPRTPSVERKHSGAPLPHADRTCRTSAPTAVSAPGARARSRATAVATTPSRAPGSSRAQAWPARAARWAAAAACASAGACVASTRRQLKCVLFGVWNRKSRGQSEGWGGRGAAGTHGAASACRHGRRPLSHPTSPPPSPTKPTCISRPPRSRPARRRTPQTPGRPPRRAVRSPASRPRRRLRSGRGGPCPTPPQVPPPGPVLPPWRPPGRAASRGHAARPASSAAIWVGGRSKRKGKAWMGGPCLTTAAA